MYIYTKLLYKIIYYIDYNLYIIEKNQGIHIHSIVILYIYIYKVWEKKVYILSVYTHYTL